MTVLPQDIGNTSCLRTSVTLIRFGVVRGGPLGRPLPTCLVPGAFYRGHVRVRG